MFRVSLWSPVLRNVIRSSASHIRTTENSTGSQNVGSVSFAEIARSPNFVDKSLFTKAILECGSKHVLITAPRRFGKSINLDMLRCFFHDKTYETLFSKLRIGNTTTMKNLGTLPVLWLNFKVAGPITSYEEAVTSCRKVIHQAFLENEFLTSSSKLNDWRKDYCKVWCDCSRYESLSVSQVTEGLEGLAECLYIHNERKSLLLIDEYDAICTAAFANVDAKTLDHIIELYGGIVGSVVKQNTKFVERAVITGILRVMCAGLSSPVNNVVQYPFSEDGKFADFYGVTEDEFNELMSRKCNSSVRHLKDEALRYYNGYTWNNNRILNPWSVMNFLDKKIVKPYWVESGIMKLRLENTNKNEAVRKCFIELSKGDTVRANDVALSAKSFQSFFEDFNEVKKKKLINIDPLLHFYFEQGYLTMIGRSLTRILLKIPNEEVKTVFLESLIIYFEDVYGIERDLIYDSVELLRELDITIESNCRNTLTAVCRNLEVMCNRGAYTENMNETILEDLMFTIYYTAGFEPTSQIRVHQHGKMYRKYDMCARIDDDTGILVEFKFNAKSADVGLQGILEKDYLEGLKKRNIFNNYLLVGMNVKKRSKTTSKNSVSISYLRNSEDINNKVEIIL